MKPEVCLICWQDDTQRVKRAKWHPHNYFKDEAITKIVFHWTNLDTGNAFCEEDN